MKTIVKNRRARYDYHMEDKFVGGIVLAGSEVKSIRNGSISINESYIQMKSGELFLINTHIAQYGSNSHEPTRDRKILITKKEIGRLDVAVRQKRYTLIPTAVCEINGRFKIEFCLAKGKNTVDKRETIKQREWERKGI